VLKVNIPPTNGHLDDTDGSEDDIWSTKVTGRQTFGGFKRQRKQPTKAPRDDADADLSSASEGEISDSDNSPKGRPNGGTDRFFTKQGHRQVSDNASPLRAHAQQQDRKRKKGADKSGGRKKARKTM